VSSWDRDQVIQIIVIRVPKVSGLRVDRKGLLIDYVGVLALVPQVRG
jgi:hypothetical protein